MSVFVVALAAEARPLIDALKLKRLLDKPWQYYSNGSDHLVLTGIGQLNAAAACAWLVGRFPSFDRQPWINVGIAGHGSELVGTLIWVERLQHDRGDFYPALHSKTQLPGSTLRTVNSPSKNYQDGSLVDMEGEGFYLTASRFAPLELVHLLKVVSDNPDNPIEQLHKASVTALVAQNIPGILDFATSLSQLATHLPEDQPEDLQLCIHDYEKAWRFSHNQRQQLEKLLSRYHALTDTLWQAGNFSEKPRDAKQALSMLEHELTQLPVVMK